MGVCVCVCVCVCVATQADRQAGTEPTNSQESICVCVVVLFRRIIYANIQEDHVCACVCVRVSKYLGPRRHGVCVCVCVYLHRPSRGMRMRASYHKVLYMCVCVCVLDGPVFSCFYSHISHHQSKEPNEGGRSGGRKKGRGRQVERECVCVYVCVCRQKAGRGRRGRRGRRREIGHKKGGREERWAGIEAKKEGGAGGSTSKGRKCGTMSWGVAGRCVCVVCVCVCVCVLCMCQEPWRASLRDRICLWSAQRVCVCVCVCVCRFDGGGRCVMVNVTRGDGNWWISVVPGATRIRAKKGTQEKGEMNTTHPIMACVYVMVCVLDLHRQSICNVGWIRRHMEDVCVCVCVCHPGKKGTARTWFMCVCVCLLLAVTARRLQVMHA